MVEKKPKRQNAKKAKKAVKAAVPMPVSEQVSSAAPVDEAAPDSVGASLRQARTAQKLTLETISASTHIRAAQLRALEEGDIAALPGMTYALGFVKTYAQFLKLDVDHIAEQFKIEQGTEATVKPELHFPEPIDEDKLPSAVTLGLAALGAVAIVLLWVFFVDSSDDNQAAELALAIEPAPIDETALATGFQPALSSHDSSVATSFETASADIEAAPLGIGATTLANQLAEAMVPQETPQVFVDPETTGLAEAPINVGAPLSVKKPRPRPDPDAPPPRVEVRSAKGRVVLKARETSWVQISNAEQKIVYKKVMQPGEQYVVPDKRGMTLITSNAGGLAVLVDGKPVQDIGRDGEIMRGVDLNPDELKIRKIRVRD